MVLVGKWESTPKSHQTTGLQTTNWRDSAECEAASAQFRAVKRVSREMASRWEPREKVSKWDRAVGQNERAKGYAGLSLRFRLPFGAIFLRAASPFFWAGILPSRKPPNTLKKAAGSFFKSDACKEFGVNHSNCGSCF